MARWVSVVVMLVALGGGTARADDEESSDPPLGAEGLRLVPHLDPSSLRTPLFEENARRTRRSGVALLTSGIILTAAAIAATFLVLYAASQDDSGESIFFFVPCAFGISASTALMIAGGAMIHSPYD